MNDSWVTACSELKRLQACFEETITDYSLVWVIIGRPGCCKTVIGRALKWSRKNYTFSPPVTTVLTWLFFRQENEKWCHWFSMKTKKTLFPESQEPPSLPLAFVFLWHDTLEDRFPVSLHKPDHGRLTSAPQHYPTRMGRFYEWLWTDAKQFEAQAQSQLSWGQSWRVATGISLSTERKLYNHANYIGDHHRKYRNMIQWLLSSPDVLSV